MGNLSNENIHDRLEELNEMIDATYEEISAAQEAVQKLAEERDKLRAVILAEDVLRGDLATLSRGLVQDDYPYGTYPTNWDGSGEQYNPYRVATDRFEKLCDDLVPNHKDWIFEPARMQVGATQVTTVKIHARHDTENFEELTEGIAKILKILEQIRSPFPNVVEYPIDILENSLSSGGYFMLMVTDKDKARLVKTTYGHEEDVYSGSLQGCLEYMAKYHYYGDPYEEDEDDEY